MREAKGKFWDLWIRQAGITLIPADSTPSGASDVLNEPAKKDKIKPSEGSSSSVSKSLRPDAPEFIPTKEPTPLHQRITPAGRGQSSHDRGTPGNKQSQYGKNAKIDRVKGKIGQKRTTTDESGHTSDTFLSDSRPTTVDSTTDEHRQEVEQRKKPSNSFPHNNGELTGSNLKHNHDDGPSDLLAANQPGIALAKRMHPRRVSASSEPAPGTSSVREASHGKKRRRSRRFPNKKRGASPSRSGNMFGSGAWSSESLQKSAPRDPFTTPTDGINTSSESNALTSNPSSVRFAPSA